MATVIPDPEDIQELELSVNLLAALLWQYTNATNLQSLLNSKQNWYNTNQEGFWSNWITDVFDLQTANQFGLYVWSIILDLPLYVNDPPSSLTQPIFGFNASFFKNFNRGGFGTNSGGTNILSMETQRLALKLRYFQLCSSGTVPEINRFMAFAFEDYGPFYLIDNLNMTQTYISGFTIPADMVYLFQNFDILPRPSGVSSTVRDGTKKYFGFGSSRLNFNRGNFQS